MTKIIGPSKFNAENLVMYFGVFLISQVRVSPVILKIQRF
ncbi:hypothetical protein BN2497_1015 [Janthinobacterium sp. CG23_2]|nr:hypothetical protein BN2497_1015 [Janthinobacterium sp. CG23_2]CUU26905.1 hypothetical protein BN3177_1015 [Janthinobacterium sp. CG23_2]